MGFFYVHAYVCFSIRSENVQQSIYCAATGAILLATHCVERRSGQPEAVPGRGEQPKRTDRQGLGVVSDSSELQNTGMHWEQQ
jgi:hypothetical protein